ncbi:hypothetical protein P7K49_021865 [Saguinus oedipus]|uniref:Uncharacterized protein n=1 Tax=Saguinus oedipus TaxID=9490 RepID=A0ABQ9UTW4_SAGOE|nr:hypothetical protein P7K49_021865 [Saguinus oedipus]
MALNLMFRWKASLLIPSSLGQLPNIPGQKGPTTPDLEGIPWHKPLTTQQHFPEHLDHFAENMEDFSNDLFSSFFDDPVLDEKSPLLDMELDSPTPGIQAEHSYSLSGDSAPQSPLVPIKMEDTTQGKRWNSLGTAQAQKAQEGGSSGVTREGACSLDSQRLPDEPPQTPQEHTLILNHTPLLPPYLPVTRGSQGYWAGTYNGITVHRCWNFLEAGGLALQLEKIVGIPGAQRQPVVQSWGTQAPSRVGLGLQGGQSATAPSPLPQQAPKSRVPSSAPSTIDSPPLSPVLLAASVAASQWGYHEQD